MKRPPLLNFGKLAIMLFILLLTPDTAKPADDNTLLSRDFDLPKIATPNAASFNKFIDNPVSPYSGNVDVNVPIYTLKDGAVSIPLSLRYNTCGIKTDEEASSVGLGWNLNVGGVITQNSVGGFDVYDIYYKEITDILLSESPGLLNISTYYNIIRIGYEAYSRLRQYCLHILTDKTYMEKLCPDVFYFSYPGGSGKFYIDHRDGNIYQLKREKNIRIEKWSQAIPENFKNCEFTITTETGIKHNFKYFSESYDPNNFMKNHSASYTLYETIYPNGQVVSYDYEKCSIKKPFRFEHAFAFGDVTASPAAIPIEKAFDDRNYFGTTTGEDFYLRKITTTNYQIDFGLTDRNDIDGWKVSGITITSSTGTKKLFTFDYDYFLADRTVKAWGSLSVSNPDQLYKRLRLLSFSETDGYTRLNTHKFDYNSTLLPPKYSYASDYWGSPNGSTEESLYPELDYLCYSNKAKVAIYTKKLPEYISTPPLGFRKKSGNRAYDFSYCQAGILTSIKYPTGGVQKFMYEPNKFIRAEFIPTKEQIEEIRNHKDYTQTVSSTYGNPKAFTLTQSEKVKLKINIRIGLNSWNDMIGSHAKIVNSQNIEIYKGSALTNCTPDMIVNGGIMLINEEFELAAGTYTLISVVTAPGLQDGANGKHGDVYATLEYGENKIPTYTDSYIETTGCGVRVKQIAHYDSLTDYIPYKTVKYEYLTPQGKTSGVLHNEITFEDIRSSVYGMIRNVATNNEPLSYSFQLSHPTLFSDNQLSNPYSMQTPVGYSYVKEIVDGMDAGCTVFNYNNSTPTIYRYSFRGDNALNGLLLSKKSFDKNGQCINSEETEYAKARNHIYAGMQIIKEFNLYPSLIAVNNPNYKLYAANDPWPEYYTMDASFQAKLYAMYYVVAYNLDACDLTVKNKTTSRDGVTIREEFVYNPNTLQIKEHQLIKSRMDTLRREYTYPNNLGMTTIYRDMITRNQISEPVEERVYRNRVYLGGRLTQYTYDNHGIPSRIYPGSIRFSAIVDSIGKAPWTFTNNAPNPTVYPTQNIIFHKYDKYGNPVHITHNERQTVYLWSYGGQFLVALIENATLTDVTDALQQSGTDMDGLAAMIQPDMSILNRLREQLPEAFVSTCEYKPLLGMVAATDPSGRISYYEYDTFGRLTTIKDGDGHPTQSYEYNYRNR